MTESSGKASLLVLADFNLLTKAIQMHNEFFSLDLSHNLIHSTPYKLSPVNGYGEDGGINIGVYVINEHCGDQVRSVKPLANTFSYP